jgi:hypothetical protein
MGLKQLAESITSRPILTRHPSGLPFHMNFPIIKRKISFGDDFDEQLIFIIRGQGDKQHRKTNVKASMTEWFMQKQHKPFQVIGDKAIKIARKNSPYDISMELFDCWGAIYGKDDWTAAHDHWPHPWSFVYYVKCGVNDSPIVFPDGYQGEHHVKPVAGEIVLFPGWLRHSVPTQLHDSERIVVAGNITSHGAHMTYRERSAS